METRIYLERKAAVIKELNEILRSRHLRYGVGKIGKEMISPRGRIWSDLEELEFMELLAATIKEDNALRLEAKKKATSAVYSPPTVADGKTK